MTKSPTSTGPTSGSYTAPPSTGPTNVPPRELIDEGVSDPTPRQPQAVIVPTIGRQVWFWPATDVLPRLDQPEAATVCYVHNQVLVNLHVLNALGEARSERSVLLCQPGVIVPDQGRYCVWMPYQIGQARQQPQLDVMGNSADAARGAPLQGGQGQPYGGPAVPPAGLPASPATPASPDKSPATGGAHYRPGKGHDKPTSER